MKLKDLLKECNVEELVAKLIEINSRFDADTYKNVIAELLKTKPNTYNEEDWVLILFPELMDLEESEYCDCVYVYNKACSNAYDISLMPWDECLGLIVSDKSVEQYGKETFVAYCIKDMTSFGRTAKDVKIAAKDVMEMQDSLFEPQESLLDYEYPKEELENYHVLELTGEEIDELMVLNEKNMDRLKEYLN